MRHLALLTILAALPLTAADAKDPDENLAFKIHEAIRTGVNWLKSKQLPEGHFGEASGKAYTPGATVYHAKPRTCAFALFTLLKCEVPTTDPVITKGFAFLRGMEWKGTYENAICIMAFRELYHRATIEYAERRYKKSRNPEREVDKFLKKLKGKSAAYGISKSGSQGQTDYGLIQKATDKIIGWQFSGQGWRYGDLGGNDGDQDVSATHLALFGLKAAIACNIRVDRSIFANAAQYLLAEQDQTGEAVQRQKASGDGSWSPMDGDRARGWPYMSTSQIDHEKHFTGSMTGAGICGLMVCKGQLLKTGYWRKMGKKIDKGINDGVAWLNQNWVDGLKENAHGPRRGTGYYWWVVERVGILGGLTLIGTHNWYLEGAQHIVAIQEEVPGDKEKGFWDKVFRQRSPHEVNPSDILNTCYALLFLKKHAHSVGIPPISRGGR